MPLPWIKMYQEALHDPKLTRLSLAERGAWWGLMQLANECAADGKIVSGGKGLTKEEIADILHIKTPEDRKSLETMITKMTERGSLSWNDDVLTVIHYKNRQSIPPSARPEAVAERVRQYRKRQKGAHAPIDIKRLGEISLRVKKKRKELGRELTPEELQDIKNQVAEEAEDIQD